LRTAHGIIAGLTAAAATTGALLVFGARLGDPLQAFVHIGQPVVGPGAPALSAALGLVAHLATVTLWGALFGLVAPRNQGMLMVILAAVGTTLASVLVHSYLLLPTLRLGAGLGGPRAPSGPIVALHLLFAAGLVAGILVARRGRA